MPINHETFGVHVEKADTSIDGAYAMINYEFANRIPEQYIYINREEDLGITQSKAVLSTGNYSRKVYGLSERPSYGYGQMVIIYKV